MFVKEPLKNSATNNIQTACLVDEEFVGHSALNPIRDVFPAACGKVVHEYGKLAGEV
jgi:hypothetical protein